MDTNPSSGRPNGPDAPALLSIRDLKVHFPIVTGLLQRQIGAVKAVDGVSFDIKKGETLGLVGESGCGKSTVGRAILQMRRPSAGEVSYNGRDLVKMSNAELKDLRRDVQMIYQDPYSSLNPRMRVRDAIAEPIRVHGIRKGEQSIKARVDELLDLVGLNPDLGSRFPHEFSGGQRQRIGIARALAMEPRFIVCDEAVSALDVSVQAQVVNLLQRLQTQFDLTYLFIAHGLAIVKHVSDRIIVMYLGKVVEIGDTERIYLNSRHPYTRSLMSAASSPDPKIEKARKRIILKGDVPTPLNPPSGCYFHTRCPLAIDRCSKEEPPLTMQEEGHLAACWRAHEIELIKDKGSS